jgi:D-amino-acid dehydrogenase
VPDLDTQGGREWMGFRPSMPDSMPVISLAPRHANVALAFGHGHLGLTQGAVTGRLVAEMLSGAPTVIDTSPFRVDRF